MEEKQATGSDRSLLSLHARSVTVRLCECGLTRTCDGIGSQRQSQRASFGRAAACRECPECLPCASAPVRACVSVCMCVRVCARVCMCVHARVCCVCVCVLCVQKMTTKASPPCTHRHTHKQTNKQTLFALAARWQFRKQSDVCSKKNEMPTPPLLPSLFAMPCKPNTAAAAAARKRQAPVQHRAQQTSATHKHTHTHARTHAEAKFQFHAAHTVATVPCWTCEMRCWWACFANTTSRIASSRTNATWTGGKRCMCKATHIKQVSNTALHEQ